ncbi:Putative glycerol-3-phosphate transporter 3 [Sarcoptes scabiei]|nr:Putative glycerol-3-phosphate transporter 3 [Sarcoptes scabiei]
MLKSNIKIAKLFLLDRNVEGPRSRLRSHRILILIITFIIYTIYHMSRKPMSVIKSKLYNGNATDPNNWAPFNDKLANSLLSVLDGVYWSAYAIGMLCNGFIAERSNLRLYLSISMTLCGLMCLISGLAFYLSIHSLTFFIVVQFLSGWFQSSGWPAVLAVMGNWFGTTKKGFIFGIWSLHTSLGNMLGTALAGVFVDFNWGLSYIVPGIICLICSLIIFFTLIPKEVDLTLESKILYESTRSNQNQSIEISLTKNKKAIKFFEAFTISGVIEFSICLFFTKSVSYIFLNWLPKYISSHGNISSSKSAYISLMFDIGGCFGSIISGLITDIIGYGSISCFLFLCLSIPSLFLLANFSHLNLPINLTLQFLNGFFINGPSSLITTTVSANLACQVTMKAATATVSAIVDGTGSIGAAIGPSIVGPLRDYFDDWNAIFYIAMIGNFLAASSLVRIVLRDTKFLITNNSQLS